VFLNIKVYIFVKLHKGREILSAYKGQTPFFHMLYWSKLIKQDMMSWKRGIY